MKKIIGFILLVKRDLNLFATRLISIPPSISHKPCLVKKLKEEKIKYNLNLTINSGDEIDLELKRFEPHSFFIALLSFSP